MEKERPLKANKVKPISRDYVEKLVNSRRKTEGFDYEAYRKEKAKSIENDIEFITEEFNRQVVDPKNDKGSHILISFKKGEFYDEADELFVKRMKEKGWNIERGFHDWEDSVVDHVDLMYIVRFDKK